MVEEQMKGVLCTTTTTTTTTTTNDDDDNGGGGGGGGDDDDSHYPQVTAMSTVPRPESGHIQHLFHHKKIPQ
jgi:hypothetical protein